MVRHKLSMRRKPAYLRIKEIPSSAKQVLQSKRQLKADMDKLATDFDNLLLE